ncbi:uncharacterized protein FA14DRAFT_159320 [Meira miltonrushii]|uniref:Uncharacterized protein n=1 Tax=Meira miltonrushii TaxID=1280837 RepID=A0A316VNP0_9BASI|nr:uncharacterized protein FA14DRAFT_159320 [Meira miltonrushii]PWN37135.1 hypothetical protein FA14DRAFT_159320 [Meira miltonrushii]
MLCGDDANINLEDCFDLISSLFILLQYLSIVPSYELFIPSRIESWKVLIFFYISRERS